MELSFLAFLLAGFLAVTLLGSLFLIVKGNRLDKSIREKQKFLKENPRPDPVGRSRFILHDN